VFSNVIVGVDGGLHGGDALALARRLVAPEGELRLVHLDVGDWAASGLPDAETVAGVKVVTEFAPSVGDGLHRLAEERGADLLVVGSSRRGMFGRVLLGDDTRASLNGAPCAVAIAPSGFSARETAFSVVGVAYNESRESEAALVAARDLADRTDAAVRALQVVPMPSYAYVGPPAMPAPFMDNSLDDAAARMARLEGVETIARRGIPGEELAAFGAEVDLLVVGSRSYGPLQRLIHGSTSDYLTRHARCALLILARGCVPAPAAAVAMGTAGAEL
jgi:nucleotide-binding universal stress UspA family protein